MIDEHRTTLGTGGFTGRAVVVTGAGSGIGRAIARAFAAAGAGVLAVGRRPDALAETAGEHPSIVPFAADLRDESAGEVIVATALARWNRLDVLVNNAGVFAAMPLAEATAARIDDLVATNLTAPSLLAKAALAPLRERGGAIINVSSTFGHRPIAGAAHYGATKAAIEQLTRSWALELAPDGVRVNAVAPGPTESEALSSAGLPEAVIAQIKAEETARIPLGRRGDPAEVADWVLRLADPAAWVTGQVLAVDGGLGLN
ncbi:SDR family oxidoreductase [Kribbella sp.]|uniref:SDR family NAD(P)-dependent oxidoreductase n=1 Tax=Kribbella sp. TaxID=1871183 RepID=UPI002D5AD272|nr:SDR family oxidoreductase [Kribbella sp.]HZX07892.1 SDR family oxidoreductase [Kribbella sp.]